MQAAHTRVSVGDVMEEMRETRAKCVKVELSNNPMSWGIWLPQFMAPCAN